MKKLSTALLIALFLLGSYFVNRVHVDIVIISDSSSRIDLDLYVYVREDRKLSGSDNGGKVCPGEITKNGYMTIKAVNRGKSADGFWLIII